MYVIMMLSLLALIGLKCAYPIMELFDFSSLAVASVRPQSLFSKMGH